MCSLLPQPIYPSCPCCRFILLACDGLFKVFTPEEAVNFILSCLEVRELGSEDQPWELRLWCVPWGTWPL